MAEATTAEQQTTDHQGSLQKYLDRAKGVLDKFGIARSEETYAEMLRLLDQVKHVDEAKAMAIAKVIQHMSEFNQLVRDNVENISIGNRYLDIAQQFDSIREDSKALISQLDDGKISFGEKIQNYCCLLYTSPSPRDQRGSRMPSSA